MSCLSLLPILTAIFLGSNESSVTKEEGLLKPVPIEDSIIEQWKYIGFSVNFALRKMPPPANVKPPVEGELIWNGGMNGYYSAIQKRENEPTRLWIDLNNNRDLTDDPVFLVSTEDNRVIQTIQFPGKKAVEITIHCKKINNPYNPYERYFFIPTQMLKGEVKIADKNIPVAVVDAQLNGLETQSPKLVIFDNNQNQTFEISSQGPEAGGFYYRFVPFLNCFFEFMPPTDGSGKIVLYQGNMVNLKVQLDQKNTTPVQMNGGCAYIDPQTKKNIGHLKFIVRENLLTVPAQGDGFLSIGLYYAGTEGETRSLGLSLDHAIDLNNIKEQYHVVVKDQLKILASKRFNTKTKELRISPYAKIGPYKVSTCFSKKGNENRPVSPKITIKTVGESARILSEGYQKFG